MEIHTTARHFELTPALRQHVEERLERIQRYLDSAPEIRVVLAVEKYRHQAELSLRCDGLDLVARGVSEDMYASVDLAVEKLLRQLKRQKERRRVRRARSMAVGDDVRIDIFASTGGELPGQEEPAPVETEHQQVELLTLRDAIARLAGRAQGVLVFARRESGRLNVLYRRPDGQLALVETQGEGAGEGGGEEVEET